MKALGLERRRAVAAHIYIIPLLAIALFVLVYPILSSIFLSFQDTPIPRGAVPFAITTGKNYARMFASEDFYQAVVNTAIIATISSLLSVIAGIATALAVNRFKVFRTLAILPWAVPAVSAVIIWGWLFDGSFGLINYVLVRFGILDSPIVWSQSPVGAVVMVVFVFIWKGYPFIAVMVIAGMQSISNDMYEAADLEGASGWSKFWSITLPQLKPVVLVSGLLNALWIFRDYPIIYLLTGGGPAGRTNTLALMTYSQAFESFNMSYGAAIGVFTLAVCFVMAYFVISLNKKVD